MMKKTKLIKYILVILLFALFLRIINIQKTIVFDEYTVLQSATNYNEAGLSKFTELTPLSSWIIIFFKELFGNTEIVMKLTSIFMGISTIFVLYLLTKEIYNEKAALWAIILISISAWNILGTTSISIDGAFLTFFYILTIFFYFKYIKLNTRVWLYLTGVAFGLAMLTKLNAILIIPIILMYSLFNEGIQNIKSKLEQIEFYKKLFFDFLIIFILSILVFSIFPILAYITDWSYFQIVLGHTKVFTNVSFNLSLLAIQFMLAIFWAGPLFIGLYILALFNFEKKDILLYSWIATVFLFFTFVVQENFRPIERYFMVFLPALCILGGRFLSKIKFDKKQIAFLMVSFLIFFGIILLLNILPSNTIPFYPKINFINSIINLNWNFLVPFTGIKDQ